MNEKEKNSHSIPAAVQKQKVYRFIIAGGGTGGHIFPAIAIANALRQKLPDASFLFIGAKGKMEMEKVPQAGYAIEGLDIAGFNRSSLIKNIALPFKLVKSFSQVRGILYRFKPTAVIGVGGYSSFPVLRVAQRKKIPTFIHESNAFAGKSNKILGKKVIKVFVATAGMEQFFPAEKIVVTGNPVRKSIVEKKVDRSDALQFFKLDRNKTTILSIGGSLGAASINQAIAAGMNKIVTTDLQLIWQTGKTYRDEAKEISKNIACVWTSEFIKEMELAYAAADIVISRAGAMSVAELCVAGKPTVFVPYPFAAEDHQTFNAKALVDKNAALMIKDSETKTVLIDTVIGLAKDEKMQQKFRENISKNAISNADEVIAEAIIQSLVNL